MPMWRYSGYAFQAAVGEVVAILRSGWHGYGVCIERLYIHKSCIIVTYMSHMSLDLRPDTSYVSYTQSIRLCL